MKPPVRWPARLLVVLAALALAACAGAPKKSASPAMPLPDAGKARRAALPEARKRSPYAPAQEDASKRGDYTRGGLYAPHIADSAPADLPDVDAIPEPEVVDEARSRYGNRSPYAVLGKSYQVRDSAEGYDETGIASYYGNKFHGRRTSNLEVYDMYAFTAAHKTLPLPSFARVTNLDNGKSVVVRVNDRGPFHEGRVIDLSYAAAVKLGVHPGGTGRVEVRGLAPGADAGQRRMPPAARQPGAAVATPLPAAGARIATGQPAAMALVAAPQAASAIDALVQGLPAAGARAPSATATTAAHDWRFDMRQDGKTMSADEFDAWMKARRARVATGQPDPRGGAAAAVGIATASAVPAAAGADVVLQVAAFAARANAERALSLLQGAGVTGAQLRDGVSAGKPVWRLRVGPVQAARLAELSARVAGLGFGRPQVVRE